MKQLEVKKKNTGLARKPTGLSNKSNITKIVILAFAVLFSACKNSLSIADYIKENTSTAKIINWDINAASRIMVDSENNTRSAFKETWADNTERTYVFYIDPGNPPDYTTPRNIELNLDIVNPQGYALRLTPEYSVFNPDSIQIYPYDETHLRDNDTNRQRSVTVTQTSPTTAVLGINHAVIGEQYKITVNTAMNDGSRIFETYTNIPSIVFNTLLSGPRNLGLYAFQNENNIYYPYARWDVPQLDDAHPGIYKITLVFQEEKENADWVTAKFIYERVDQGEEKSWRLISASSDSGDIVSTLTILPSGPMDTFRKFEVRFPMPIITDYVLDIQSRQFIESDGQLLSKGKIGDTEKEIDSAFSAYNFIVTLEDLCGLTAQSGFDDGPLANETTILESLVIKDRLTERQINEGFYIPGFINYSMEIPYDIAVVEVDYAVSEDYPDQNVLFSNPTRIFDIAQGSTRNINITVTYGNELPTTYVLSITRLSPVRDSRLAGIYAEASSRRYDTMPAFVADNTEQAYSIYVPSTVASIALYTDLPEMQSGDPGYGTFWPPGTKIPSIVSIEDFSNEYPPEDGSYKRVDGKWILPLETGSNLFRIDVKPEAGINSGYTVVIVRAQQATDDTADLSGITVNALGNSITLMPGFDGHEQESYTVNVPNAYTNVTVTASVKNSLARVTNIRTPGVTESLPIQINGNSYSADVTGLEAGGSYPVTATVVSPDGASRRDYHVLVNRMLPAAAGISWREENRAVTVNWSPVSNGPGVSGTVSYELYYHTANISNPANIPSVATKWAGTPSAAGGAVSATVSGLENARRYYFWLRAMNGLIPGEWTRVGTIATVIQPRSNNARLSELSVSGAGPVAPAFSGSLTYPGTVFAAVVPFSVSSVTISAAGQEAGTDANGTVYPAISYDPSQSLSLASGGASETAVIKVQAHDPSQPFLEYGVTVHRRLPPPTWQGVLETNNQVTIAWNMVIGASYYDVYYHTSNISEPSNIPLEAVKFTGTISGTGCTITSLENAADYYFWVRAVQSGIPVIDEVAGEWSAARRAMPKSNNASLAGITVAGGIPIVPLAFSDAKNYSVIIPYSPEQITVTGIRAEPNQTLNYAPSGGIISPVPGGYETVSILVRAHDGTVNFPAYTVRVDRMLPGLEWLSAPLEAPQKVTLNWESLSPPAGQTLGYEVYYRHNDITPPPSPPNAISGSDPNWLRDISGNTLEIAALTNGERYYFWVRGIIGGIPGEWSAAESGIPRSDAADLAGISVTGGALSPSFSNANPADNYTADVPSGTGTVVITIDKRDIYQQINYSREGGTSGTLASPAPDQDRYTVTLGAGTSSVLTLTVRSQDGKEARTYKVTMNRRPANPALSAAAKNRSVDLSWTAAAGANAYELYYHTSDISAQAGFPQGTTLWNGNISGTSVTVTGLANTQGYYFWLRSKSTGDLGGSIYTVYSQWAASGQQIPLSDAAELASLTPVTGTLSPAFSSNTLSYYLITPQGDNGPFTLNAAAFDGGTLDSASVALPLNASRTFTVTSQDGKNSKTYTVYSQAAGITVNFVLPGDLNESIALSPSPVVSWTGNTPITITGPASGSYSFQWYADNVPIQGETGSTLATNARAFSVAKHTVTLRITTNDGFVFSKSVTFNVER